MGGAVAAIDIDIAEDPALALEIEKLARERLGDTPAARIGRAPKRMLVYRTDAPFKGIKRHPLEVLCLGQQFVAYGVHPQTDLPYQWEGDSPVDTPLEAIPLASKAQVEAARKAREAASAAPDKTD